MISHFWVFGVFFIVLFVLELIYFRLADKFNIIDKPNQRSSHTAITLRGGGIIFYIAILLYFLFFGFSYPWFFAGLTLISIISFADDIRPRSSKFRLSVHFISILLLFYQWDLFSFPWYFGLLALIFCTGLLNAYNFMDGINGITGMYSLSILLSLLFFNHLSLFVDNNLIYTVVLSLLVFNFFNFRKKAQCFAGDIGAFSIAFIILFLLGLLILKTQNVSYIVFLAVYGVDSILTIVHRLLLKENIFEAHRKHAYQLLSNELKLPHTLVAGSYALLQLAINAGLYFMQAHAYFYLLLVIVVLSIAYVLFKKKYFYLHQQQ